MSRAALVAILVLVAVGCGEAPPRPMRRFHSDAMPFLSLEHVNQMGTTFELIGLSATVDGHEVLALEGEDVLPSRLCVSRGQASIGAHDIRVRARYRGHGFGVFSYLNGYRFNATATTRVEIPEDAYGLAVRSEGFENGGVTQPLEQRPHIRFVARVERDNAAGGCVPGAPAPAPQPPAP